MIALAVALHIGLHAKSERLLEAVLYALLAGDAAHLVAMSLLAAEDGWRLNTTNSYGLVFTVLCVVVRLVMLRDWWARKRARPQRLAALAHELDSVQEVVRQSMELSAYVAYRTATSSQLAAAAAGGAANGDAPSDTSDAGAFKED